MMDQTMNNDTEYLEAANAKLNEVARRRRTPGHEIWLASRLGGYHFRERDGVWHDTRTDATLEEKLEEAVKALTA